jgi:hypothetical protein
MISTAQQSMQCKVQGVGTTCRKNDSMRICGTNQLSNACTGLVDCRSGINSLLVNPAPGSGATDAQKLIDRIEDTRGLGPGCRAIIEINAAHLSSNLVHGPLRRGKLSRADTMSRFLLAYRSLHAIHNLHIHSFW